ncbi:MAG TPA: rhomboid family intramembrane serine protease [Thermoplasmata archaeon]|nr:rhomboid family intramembrane serine protease [Thermoplasmata archaeon]
MAFGGVSDPLSYVAVAVIVAAILYSFWRKALLTFTITVACVVVFGLEVVSESAILDDLALFHVAAPFGLFSPPWTYVTYQFLHFGISHLLFNILALMLIAPPFEDRIGSLRFGVLYFVGGIVGGAGFLLIYFSQSISLVGASASISAVFGAYGRLYPRDRLTLFFPLPGLPTFRVIDVVIAFLLLETVLGFVGRLFGPLSGIAWLAHVIAMAFGFAAAPLVMRIPSKRQRPLKKIAFASWQALATTPELRGILEEAQRADLPEIRDAWIEKFVRAMRCPRCGGPVKRSFGRLTSPCGWKAKIE